MSLALIIPTYNAERYLPELLGRIAMQSLQPDDFIVVDSNSQDRSQKLAREAGARVLGLGERKFNHSGTRRWAAEQTNAETIIFLTHDAMPADASSFANIVGALARVPDAGMAYGRQLPNPDANALARHHRLFNYPEETLVKRKADISHYGMKTCFASDSFSAYRAVALHDIGSFPEDLIFGEDSWVAGQMILQGYAVVYCGDASVFHSHNYSIAEEFRRYFDAGVFQSRNQWIARNFGGATGEGLRFVQSELGFLRKSGHPWLMPKALIATAAKFAGFRAGHLEKHLPRRLKRKLSMFSAYWA